MFNQRNGLLYESASQHLSMMTVLSIALLTFTSSAWAQSQTMTLTTAVKQTLNQHPSLKVFTYREKALDGLYQTANLAPGYALNIEAENFAGTGTYSGASATQLTVSLSSIIEMGDKRNARLNRVVQQRAFVSTQRKAQAFDLLGQVTRRYIAVLAAQHYVKLSLEAVNLAQQTVEEVTKRSRAGVAPTSEVKRSLASVGVAQLTAANEERKLDYAKLALAMMWNDTAANFNRVEGELYHLPPAVDFEQLINNLTNNPSLLKLANEQRVKEAQVRLLRSQSHSDISWSVGIKRDPATDHFAFNAGFTVPLFANKRNRGSLIAAQAGVDEVAAKEESLRLNLQHQLYRAYTGRQQAIETISSLTEHIISPLSLALIETKSAYLRGRNSLLDYLSIQQELLVSRRALIDAGASALYYGAEIEALTAQPLPQSQYKLIKEFKGINP